MIFFAETGGSSGLTMIANIKTLDMGMFGALIVSGLVIYLHNKYFDTELPDWLGSFNGSTFIFMIGFFVMLPVDGVISLVADTLHAYGITTADGLELLVHIGINTVELNGEGFTTKVKAGDNIKAGQLLCEVDMKLMQEKGYQMHTPILMTNGDECADVQLLPDKNVKAGETTVITYRK